MTLFGQSGGGAKITALLNSPAAAAVFHRAVVQSGSYATEYLDQSVSRRVGARVLAELGIGDDVDAIQDVRYADLLDAGKAALAAVGEELAAEGRTVGRFGNLGWGPVTEGEFLPGGVFTNETAPIALGKSILIGTTKHEFSLAAGGIVGDDMAAVQAVVDRTYGEDAETFMQAVRAAYPQANKPSDYLDIDLGFRRGALRDAAALAEAGHESVYVYLFAWESPVNDGALKSMHCMELPFVFYNIDHGREITGGGEGAWTLAATVSDAWINFARSGDPNAAGLPDWPSLHDRRRRDDDHQQRKPPRQEPRRGIAGDRQAAGFRRLAGCWLAMLDAWLETGGVSMTANPRA